MLINTREEITSWLKAQEKTDMFLMCSSDDFNIQMVKRVREVTQQEEAPVTHLTT